jgi:hypothetical protein
MGSIEKKRRKGDFSRWLVIDSAYFNLCPCGISETVGGGFMDLSGYWYDEFI